MEKEMTPRELELAEYKAYQDEMVEVYSNIDKYSGKYDKVLIDKLINVAFSLCYEYEPVVNFNDSDNKLYFAKCYVIYLLYILEKRNLKIETVEDTDVYIDAFAEALHAHNVGRLHNIAEEICWSKHSYRGAKKIAGIWSADLYREASHIVDSIIQQKSEFTADSLAHSALYGVNHPYISLFIDILHKYEEYLEEEDEFDMLNTYRKHLECNLDKLRETKVYIPLHIMDLYNLLIIKYKRKQDKCLADSMKEFMEV